MSPEPSRQSSGSSGEFRDELLRIRLRARATLLLEAFLAAVIADFLYDLVGLGIFLLTGKSNYFPPFLFVVFAIFALYALRKTRFLPFCRNLDRKHQLKDRLAAAETFRLSGRIPDDIVEAQARESLAAIDFPGIRKTFRPRIAAPLAAITVLACITVAIALQYPELYTPMNFFSRQGRQIVTAFRHRTPIEGMMEEARRQNDNGETGAEDEAGADEAAEEAPPGGETAEAPPGELPPGTDVAEENAPEEKEEMVAGTEKTESTPEASPTDEKKAPDSPKPGGGGEKAAAPEATGGVPGKVRAVEETTRPSPLAGKPYAGLAPEPFQLDGEKTRGYLPPIPFFKLFAEAPTKETLIDPDAINIVPEAYEEKYRRHIIAYFEKLQSLRGDSHGP